jgi:hypothetical protein
MSDSCSLRFLSFLEIFFKVSIRTARTWYFNAVRKFAVIVCKQTNNCKSKNDTIEFPPPQKVDNERTSIS